MRSGPGLARLPVPGVDLLRPTQPAPEHERAALASLLEFIATREPDEVIRAALLKSAATIKPRNPAPCPTAPT